MTSNSRIESRVMTEMKTIKVVAAIIRKENCVFATQRGYGDYKDWWEFPGGKVELGETPEEALVREIKEELASDILVEKYLTTVEHDYPEFHLSMACYWCSVKSGKLTLLEHEAVIDEMAYRYYKNYYSYEMDHDFGCLRAV